MKSKFFLIAMLVVLLAAALPCSGLALSDGAPGLSDYTYQYADMQTAKNYQIKFGLEHQLGDNDKWDVYSAPALDAVRGANGNAYLHTGEEVYSAGWSGAWLMVRYPKVGGGYRVGWTPRTEMLGGKVEATRNVNFAYWTVELSRSCAISDDPLYESDALAYASAGERLTYLGYYRYNNGREYAYVQGLLNGHPVAGFIPFDAIAW